MFEIKLTQDANADAKSFRKSEQVLIRATLEKQLRHQPNVETTNRKRLRPGHLSEWHFALGVFGYSTNEVDEESSLVRVVAIGRKAGSRLFFQGEEYRHEDDHG